MIAEERLREAAQIIDAALALMDTSGVNCPTCGRRVFTDLAQARLHEQLIHLPEKLRRAADKISQTTSVAGNSARRGAPLQKEE